VYPRFRSCDRQRLLSVALLFAHDRPVRAPVVFLDLNLGGGTRFGHFCCACIMASVMRPRHAWENRLLSSSLAPQIASGYSTYSMRNGAGHDAFNPERETAQNSARQVCHILASLVTGPASKLGPRFVPS